MIPAYRHALSNLETSGWTVRLQQSHRHLPEEITRRYGWVPRDVEEFVAEVEIVANRSETAWILGMPDFTGEGSSAFHWNEWERQSLDAAKNDATWSHSIKSFWDQHFPVANSVKSGYAYFAIRKVDLRIVCGEEPEFEETRVIATSFHEFLNLLAEPKSILRQWI